MNMHAAAVSHAGPWIELRTPTVGDGASIWRLVKDSPPLEQNSCYTYLLLCRDFSNTCIVAEADGELAGFVCGYRRPSFPETVFVWQVAVGARGRRRGLGVAMLVSLLARQTDGTPAYLEATVSPSNEPSRRLFRKLARELETGCEETALFATDHFGEGDHEEEILFRVGPIEPERLSHVQRRLLKNGSNSDDFNFEH